VAAMAMGTDWLGKRNVPFDVLAGLASMGLLVWCQRRRTRAGGKGAVVSFLECKAAAFLGAISYSVYLMHAWVVFLFHRWTGHLFTSAGAALAVMMAGGIPLAVVWCWGFHLVFERPFLNSGPRRK